LGLDLAEALERALQRGPLGQVIRQLRFAWDTVHNRWNLWVLGYNKDRQQRFLQVLGFAEMAWLSVALWMAAIMLTLLLLVSLLLWWRSRQRVDPVQHLYRKFCRRLARVGIARRPWEGPLDFAHRTSATFPHRAQEIHAITQAYIGLRYGPPAEAQKLVTQLRQGVRTFRLRSQRSTQLP